MARVLVDARCQNKKLIGKAREEGKMLKAELEFIGKLKEIVVKMPEGK